MDEKKTEVSTWAYSDGSLMLRIDGEMSPEIENVLTMIPFDGLDVGEGVGSFECLVPFSQKIKWLHAPAVASSLGLDKLQFIERIIYISHVPVPPVDYSLLPRLKSLRCNIAELIPAKYLNHPHVERMDIEGIKATDMKFLSDAKNLGALRIVKSPIKSLDGIDNLSNLRELRLILIRALNDISRLSNLTQLEILEFDKTPNVIDISPVYELRNLRYLFIDASKAKQNNLNWIRNMPSLECAGIWVETEVIDWNVFAEHPRLYDIIFYTTKNFVAESDEEIIAVLTASGRHVNKLTRFPKAAFPAFRIEFVPPQDIVNPKPQHTYQNHLLL